MPPKHLVDDVKSCKFWKAVRFRHEAPNSYGSIE